MWISQNSSQAQIMQSKSCFGATTFSTTDPELFTGNASSMETCESEGWFQACYFSPAQDWRITVGIRLQPCSVDYRQDFCSCSATKATCTLSESAEQRRGYRLHMLRSMLCRLVMIQRVKKWSKASCYRADVRNISARVFCCRADAFIWGTLFVFFLSILLTCNFLSFLFCSVLSCLVLFCPVLSCPVLSCC